MKKLLLIFSVSLFLFSCGDDSEMNEFTGNELEYQLIPGSVDGNETSGILTIKERSNGKAQIDIRLEGVIANANHPVHLHYGSLEDDGNIATMLNPVIETNGLGQSVTLINELENGEEVSYADLITFDGSIKIHFEASGPMKDELLGSTNIGSNSDSNAAYLCGTKSISVCNSEY